VVERDLNRVLQGTLFGDALVSARVAALLADDEGYYVAVNDEACMLTGYPRDHLTGFRAGVELAADDESQRIYEKLTNGSERRGLKRVRRSTGETITCEYWGIPTEVATLPFFILLLWAAALPAALPSTY
jgi:PAS domain S-box-containing protein